MKSFHENIPERSKDQVPRVVNKFLQCQYNFMSCYICSVTTHYNEEEAAAWNLIKRAEIEFTVLQSKQDQRHILH